MPLAFRTRNHGVVAFGFFNIASDLLLLDHLFFFADRFARAAVALRTPAPGAAPHLDIDGWRIDDPRRLGDLHGAIAGRTLHGFLGDTYRRWPFPRDPAAFRQDPAGASTRQEVEEMLGRWGLPLALPFTADARTGAVTAGGYLFEESEFDRMIAYVDRGGWPRWRDDVRPPCVREMMDRLRRAGRAPAPFDPDAGP
jgi:hypothetical protein